MVTQSWSNILMGYRVSPSRDCHLLWSTIVICSPSVDHTLGTSAGYYVFIESSYPQQYGDKAWLVSEVLESPMGACLDFWYHMKGATTGNLTVLHRVLNQEPTVLWSMEVSRLQYLWFHCIFFVSRVIKATYGSMRKSIFHQQRIITISFFKVLWYANHGLVYSSIILFFSGQRNGIGYLSRWYQPWSRW